MQIHIFPALYSLLQSNIPVFFIDLYHRNTIVSLEALERTKNCLQTFTLDCKPLKSLYMNDYINFVSLVTTLREFVKGFCSLKG